MSSPSRIDSKTNEEEQKTTEVQVVPVVANKFSTQRRLQYRTLVYCAMPTASF